MLRSTKTEHQHSAKHKNAGERVVEGIHEAIFKLSICPSTPFFESLAKKPPMTMNDLFRRASKYSMLEDDVRAATQQVLVAGQASKVVRKEVPKFRTGQGRPVEGRKNKAARNNRPSHPFPNPMRNFSL
ncbi:hypothetical protein CK203_023099 [Vitis vinifera]|uniref:Uncharacterized protein n=1 Tax=Vitis vinifera TaxID=29760 RepID=A0A438J489_VITVI|nr:hypothetical protein CK203_023099 [Vitis vinifera]